MVAILAGKASEMAGDASQRANDNELVDEVVFADMIASKALLEQAISFSVQRGES